MESLQGQMGELRFTLEIKRKETGKVEIVEMVGFVDEAKLKEYQNGSHPLDSSPQRGD
jgi:hypothetical protein